MSVTFCKSLSAIILTFVVFINTIGNFIGVGDIIPTQPSEETTTAVDETEILDKEAVEDFVAFYNEETAKIVENGSYKVSRNSAYTSPIDVGGATETLNAIIGAIDENYNLDRLVGEFLCIGSFSAEYPDYSGFYSNYLLKAATLKASDIKSFSEEDGVYTFTLATTINPLRNGSTPLADFTDDFITQQEIADNISMLTSTVKVESFQVIYDSITVKVAVEDGKITNIKYSYDFIPHLTIKAIVKISGTCAVETKGEYTDIVY